MSVRARGTSAGRVAGLAAGLALIALAGGIIRYRQPHDPRPNLILISIDTLRADHLGYEGYARDTSPELDRLARDSRRYREAFAPAPWTLPSHAALLTGVHPRRLGIEDRDASLPESAPRLAEALSRGGYETAAFVDSLPRGFVGAARGFGRGFDRYVHLPAEASGEGAIRYDTARSVDRALEWLGRTSRRRPFFLFLHTKSAHALPSSEPGADPRHFPYDKPEPWRSQFLAPELAALSFDDPELGRGVTWLRRWNESVAAGERRPEDLAPERIEALVALYDAGIRYVDHHLGRLFAGLVADGRDADTVILVTADHGEAFREHELLLHKELHRELLRVPLLVRVPGEPGGRDVRQRVTLMDVAPTLLALANVRTPAGAAAADAPGPAPVMAGRMLPARDGEGDPAPLFTYYRSWPDGYYEAYGVRDGDHSLIHRRLGRGAAYETFLYDVARDPGERRPLGPEHEAAREALWRELSAWRDGMPGAPRSHIQIDAETARHLQALGYLEEASEDAPSDPGVSPGRAAVSPERATDSSSRP